MALILQENQENNQNVANKGMSNAKYSRVQVKEIDLKP
jgi:hypothetical protein